LEALDNFYLNQEEPNRSCLLALREIFLRLDEHITAEWKYGGPFFYYKNKMFCYLWIDKKTKEPYIGVAEGRQLDHPLLESGNRKRIKILRVNPNKDIPKKEIEEVLQQVMKFY